MCYKESDQIMQKVEKDWVERRMAITGEDQIKAEDALSDQLQSWISGPRDYCCHDIIVLLGDDIDLMDKQLAEQGISCIRTAS